jgi:hypothetical protein
VGDRPERHPIFPGRVRGNTAAARYEVRRGSGGGRTVADVVTLGGKGLRVEESVNVLCVCSLVEIAKGSGGDGPG